MKRRFDILLPLAHEASSSEWCWRDDWNVSGQSAFMLLAKFQQLNSLSCTAVAMMFLRNRGTSRLQLDVDLRDAEKFDLVQMSNLMRMSLPDVAAAFPQRFQRTGATCGPSLRWCTQCASKGVHLTVFQFTRCNTCPLHGCALRDRCAQCGQAMIVYRLRASLFRAPFSCPSCGHDWAPALRRLDDRALRLSPAYRHSTAQGLGRGWFGRRSPNVARLLRLSSQTAKRLSWLASAPHCGSGLDPGEDFCQRVVRGETDASRHLLALYYDRDCAYGNGAPRSHPGEDITIDALACYKAIKRYVLRSVGRGHRSCSVSAARHLTWCLDARTTTPFCPVAHALLRWRTKWEGVRIPSHLLARSEHGPLGILVWLSLLAPVGLAHWSTAADRWVILHALAQACLDSFNCYLREADDGTGSSGPVWMPFPVVDFQEREWVVLDRDSEGKAEPLRLIVARGRTDRIAEKAKPQVNGEHHRQRHLLALNEDTAPSERLIMPTWRRRDVSSDSDLAVTDPLRVHRNGDISVTAMVVAVLLASDAE
ncbi:hypothetical protein [Paraburkholderia sp. MM5384-R2]|uniref:hypothetical protein n=1 Tax=Paraburkholderia sp. MM5384-R2 TaxID=2723097 RepID=UPI0016180AB2|nr:hypothetical protein [Paraburkholderia sp. MM5384-R2]MBB5498728.1 putative RNA-binding Zn-ribbon protein involved in translation (DUF1610 family) [Paraburkholderia sp. MM5384-R2]